MGDDRPVATRGGSSRPAGGQSSSPWRGSRCIDLNPVAVGISAVPEASEPTSIKERVDHVQAQSRTEDLKAARTGSGTGSAASAGLEESHWLCPIEDRLRLDSVREGMVEGFSLGNFLLPVDDSARLFREGKAALWREVSEILDRLGSSAEHRDSRLTKLRQRRLLGRFFATTRQGLQDVAERLGQKRAEPRRLPGIVTPRRDIARPSTPDRAVSFGRLGGFTTRSDWTLHPAPRNPLSVPSSGRMC